MLLKLKLLYLERITHVFESNICRRQELSFVLFDFILYSESDIRDFHSYSIRGSKEGRRPHPWIFQFYEI